MQELIKEYYKLVDKMADKAYEESQLAIEPILRKHGLKKLSLKINKVDDIYKYPLDICDMFTKKSDCQKLNKMFNGERLKLEDELLEELRYIFEIYPDSVIFQMLDNISITNKHNFVIEVKY